MERSRSTGASAIIATYSGQGKLMTKDFRERILWRYDEEAANYDGFRKKMEDVCKEIARDADVRALSVTSRLKERGSLSDKLQRTDKNYSNLEDVTDIAGVRITTYFADDVDKIAACIAREFDVDWDNSTNKKEVLDPDRFGYLSWHHVVSWSSNRAALPEYRMFAGLKAEIQTRSVLQHAWAEIEHDLGYKNGLAVPRGYSRRLSRLAGLLELADQEFENIRDGLEDYRRDIPGRIEDDPQGVEIDKDSLIAYRESSPLVAQMDEQIASMGGMPISKSATRFDDNGGVTEANAARLKRLEVETVGDLDAVLREYKPKVLAFVTEWIAEERNRRPITGIFPEGICVYYLVRVLAAETQNVSTVRVIEQLVPRADDDDALDERARRIIETYNRISEIGGDEAAD